jgi:hypothetical protein
MMDKNKGFLRPKQDSECIETGHLPAAAWPQLID